MKNFLKIKKLGWLPGLVLIIILAAITLGFYPKKNLPKINLPTDQPSVMTNKNLGDFYLLMPKIDVEVPVVADVDGADKNAYFKALEGGVAQMKSTAKPGEGSNIFIFGHSSFYATSPGNFKEVFKNLNQLKNGDEITIGYNKKKYQYIVTETKTVDPNDISITSHSEQEQLTLMTCWPPGTIEKRYVVIAELKK